MRSDLGGRPLGRGVLFVGVVLTVVALIVGVGRASSAATTCTLAPVLRDVTANQGLGSYSPLVRGKETLVRLYLSSPSCAASGSSIQVSGGSLTVKNGTTTLASGIGPTPALAPTYPTLAPYSSAAATDSTGDPKFVVPGSALAPQASTAAYTASFSVTINYIAHASKTDTIGTARTITFTNLANGAPITKAVAARTNALRILVVPMGSAAQPFESQFSEAARASVQNGMSTLSRILPVPDGIGALNSTTGGIRYSINPTLLDTSTLLTTINGVTKFCGNATNFRTAVRGLLSQYLQNWNVANPATPADRVLGVIDSNVSFGGGEGCNDAYAALNGQEAWVRALPDGQSPSMTGALMAMELVHTMGAVSDARNDGGYHSIYANADYLAGDANRAYNVTTRSFLVDDHTVMDLLAPWHNANTVLERDDYATILCRLGGPTTQSCTAAGGVGSAVGVGADSTFVLSGTTNGTAAGTHVTESYFATGAPRTEAIASSDYKLVFLNGSTPLRTENVLVSFGETDHDGTGAQGGNVGVGVFSVARPFATDANRIELWKGAVGSGTLLYSRTRNATAPQVTSVEVGPPSDGEGGGGGSAISRISVGSDGAQLANDSVDNDISGDGRYVAFDSTSPCIVTHPRSIVGDTPADITFVSSNAHAVDIFWLDYSGARVFYNTLPSGASYTQPTWITHPWVAIDKTNGQCIGYTLSDAVSKTYTIPASPSYGVYVRDHLANTTRMMAQDGLWPAISDDGQYVAFATAAALDAADANGVTDTYVVDRDPDANGIFDESGPGKQRTTLMSVDNTGQAVGSYYSEISGNGRFILFKSNGIDYVTDRDGNSDTIFDNSPPVVGRVSLNDAGVAGEGQDGWADISYTGRYVAFMSNSTILVPGGVTGSHIYARDRATGTTKLVSVATDGTVSNGYEDLPGISPDGRFIAFSTSATNLYPGDDNGVTDCVIHDRDADGNGVFDEAGVGKTQTRPLRGNCGDTYRPSFSPNFPFSAGVRFIAFDAPRPGAETQEIVVQNLDTGASQVITPTTATNGGGWMPRLAGDGRYVSFYSGDPNLVGGDTNGVQDVFLFDRSGGGSEEGPPPVPAGQQPVTVSATGGGDLLLDLYLVCGSGSTTRYPIAVALQPTSSGEGGATFDYNLDPTFACLNGHVEATVNDGFQRSAPTTDGQPAVASGDRPPTASIYSPLAGTTFLQYANVPLNGLVEDPDVGVLPGSAVSWTVSGQGINFTATGKNVDVAPRNSGGPSGGWTPGTYNVTLTATSEGVTATATSSFTVVGDADNDGLSTTVESQSCFGTGGDSDPLNAWADADGDGIPNAEDVYTSGGPCGASTFESVTAIGTFDPATFNVPSNGNYVTMSARASGRDMTEIVGGTVRLTRIRGATGAGFDVSANPDFQNVTWDVVNNVGYAKFDRQKLIAFLQANKLVNQRVTFTMEGRSSGVVNRTPGGAPRPPWHFTATASTLAQKG